MSSPRQFPCLPPARPPTPGIHLSSTANSAHQRSSDNGDNESPLRLASLDLTSTRDTYNLYDTWTELQEIQDLSQTKRGDSDTQKLLDTSGRRSSIASNSSSASTIVKQGWAVRWLNSIGSGISAFWKLPGVRQIVWLLQWFDRTSTRLLSRTRFQGWRMGIILGCCMSSIVLGVNITVLVVGGVRDKGFRNGFAVPMSGLAEDVSWWSSAIHIVINALSTLLLAASNYTMQVLSSPTREDVDRAHARNEHLDIGVLSLRNLRRIRRRRLLLFIIMGLSSIPIHLFYNSAVFYIGANNEYDLYAVHADSLSGLYITSQLFDRIEGTRWIQMYDNSLVSYGHVGLVIDEFRTEIENKTATGRPAKWPNIGILEAAAWNNGVASWNLTTRLKKELGTPEFIRNITATGSISKEWIRFDRLFRLSESPQEANNPPRYAHVSHAYAQRLDTASRIQLSLTFLVIVIVCNSVKLLTMLWVVFLERQDYIVTLGDGASTFLKSPDPKTERMCILSKPEVVCEVAEASHAFKHDDQLERLVTQSGKRWRKQYSTYSNALNRDREVGSYFIFIVLGALFALLIVTITYSGQASPNWGTRSDTTFRESDPSSQQTLLNAWIANAAQLVLSFCYLAINSECTAMAGAAEWNNLASSHKGLRVTRPVGQQRDTYFLQLPYRWSLPLTIASGGLHWLLSQSIFLVRIDTYDRSHNIIQSEASKSACGFSGTSFITLAICFWLLVGIVGLIGRKKIKVQIPFAASCSLVISAACHTTADDADAHLRPVKWGVVERRMYDGELHCSLSSNRVSKPKADVKYL